MAPRLAADGVAPDGTIEAVHVIDAPGFAVGVQWHPEYDFETDAVSRGIFELFGRALRDRFNTIAAAAD
jgi:putative glutamine amidotransferase